MKALTLTQPWATAVILGNKRIETRSWRTNYRGRIAIHAAKGFPKLAKDFAQLERTLGRCPTNLPFGMIIGLATITGMEKTEDIVSSISALERHYGDFSFGRWAWILSDVEPLDNPVPAVGRLQLWEWEESTDQMSMPKHGQLRLFDLNPKIEGGT